MITEPAAFLTALILFALGAAVVIWRFGNDDDPHDPDLPDVGDWIDDRRIDRSDNDA